MMVAEVCGSENRGFAGGDNKETAPFRLGNLMQGLSGQVLPRSIFYLDHRESGGGGRGL
jgi:hypothetical protein